MDTTSPNPTLPGTRVHEPVDLVRETCALIDDADAESMPTLAELGERLGVSPFHLQRTFKRCLGVSPREYAEATRLERFKIALRASGNVASALYEAGYGSSSRLYETAKQRLGMTPASYGKGGRGAVIGYTIASSLLGRMLVAATGNGVCRIAFDDDDEILIEDLAEEYPLADVRRDDTALGEFADALAGMMDTADTRLADVPLDVRASAFQAEVWSYLRSIPPGETRSYRDIARALGKPNGARAVGNACAVNPVAVVVPCHRAVGTDGTLHGYRWGLARKRRLLDHESTRAEGATDADR